MANESFVQQRRFSGLDLYHPPQDVGPNELLQSDNCVNYGGELWTRPGFQGVLASPMSDPIYAATEFVRTDGSTVILFVSGGKLYFTVKQDPPMTPTEIMIGGTTSFGLTSEEARIYVEGKYAYVVDGEYAYSDLVVDNTDPNKVTSTTRPFVDADALYKQLTVTRPTSFTPGTYLISSVSGGAAELSASPAVTGAKGGIGTLAGPLYRVNVSADGSSLAVPVTGLTAPGSAPSCSLTNSVQEPVDDASVWHSFPSFSGNALASVTDAPTSPIAITLKSRTITDLGIPAVANQVTSASFTSADVGSVLKITSTSPFRPGSATITAVSGTTATLSYNPFPITSETQPIDYVAGTVPLSSGHAIVLPVTLADGMRITVSGVEGNVAANGTWYVVGTGDDVTYNLYGSLAYSSADYVSAAYGNLAAVASTPTPSSTYTPGTGSFTIEQLVANPGFNSTANNSNHPHVAAGSAEWWTNGQGGSTSFDLPQWHYSPPSVAYGSALFLDSYGPVLQITRATNQYGVSEPAYSRVFKVSIQAVADGNSTLTVNVTPWTGANGTGTQMAQFTTTQTVAGGRQWRNFDLVASFANLPSEPQSFTLEVTGPNGQGNMYADNFTMVPIDVRLVPSIVNGSMKVAANDPVGIGAYSLGGVWMRRDYTVRSVSGLSIVGSTLDLVTGGSFTSADVGRALAITNGSGFTLATYKITAVSSGNATLSAVAGSVGASSGVGVVLDGVDWSTTNAVAMAYSAPSGSGNIPMRMGFQSAAQTGEQVVWTYPSTFITDATGTYLYTDISTVPSDTRAFPQYVYIQILNDLPTTVDPTNLFTLGPITASGNLTVGSGDYVYVVTEADDTRFRTDGTPTGVTTDGVVESNPSPPSALLTPTGINDQTKMTIPAWTNTTSANYFYVYRLGGPFTATDPIATYRLIARLPKWTNVIDASSPGASYCTWDPSTLTFTDNTPDGALFTLVSTLVSGHDAPPVGVTCVTGWRGRVVLAKDASLYVSDLLNTDAAAALYYPTVNVPNDPNGVVKGWIVPVSPNDGDTIKQIVASGQYLLIFKGRSLSVMSGTNPYDFVLTEHLKLAGVGLAAPQGVAVVEDAPWFVGLNAIWKYSGGETPQKTSMLIEPAIAPQTKGGEPIPAAARVGAVADYHDQRFYVAMPGGAEDSSNTVIWVYDARGQAEGATLGWTRFIPPVTTPPQTISITSICSLSAADDTGDLFFGADDGQLYEHTGTGDIRSFVIVTDASKTLPIVVTTSTAHGFVDHDTVLVRGVVGNAVANGMFYVNASGYDPNQFGLYSDEALTVGVDGRLAGVSTLADLTIDAGDSTKVTSSTYSFGPSDVGKSINIVSGTGFTPSTPHVVSVSGGAAKLSSSIGAPGSSRGSSQAYGTASVPMAVAFTVKSRGMGQEVSGIRWFETNRPTRMLARLTTQETTSVTLSCSTDNQSPAVVSTVTHVDVPAGAIQLRDKVSAEVRGDTVFVTLSGATIRPTRVTSVAVEAAEGSIRGNA